jgi:hypothetical protein
MGITRQKLQSLHNGITIVFTFFFQGFIFTYDTFTSFNSTNNMKLLNANYECKRSNLSPLYTFKNERMNSYPHSFTFIPHVSNQTSSATYIFFILLWIGCTLLRI